MSGRGLNRGAALAENGAPPVRSGRRRGRLKPALPIRYNRSQRIKVFGTSRYPMRRIDHPDRAAPADAVAPRRDLAAVARQIVRLFAAIVLIALCWTIFAPPARAQEEILGPLTGPNSVEPAPRVGAPRLMPVDDSMPPPIPQLHIRQEITGSMMVSPPYGIAPLQVGFFVLADDPEGIGFLTYSWNFGDGTVSSLPPELYIFHTYRKPGTYVCTLTAMTVDGREKTFIQGVIVRPPGD